MKVYVKKGESESAVIHYIMSVLIITPVVLLMFLGITHSNFYFDFKYIFSSYPSFINFIAEYGFSIIISLVFASIPLLIYGSLIVLLVKPPKNFKAKLVSKKTDTYNGQQITYMKFVVENKNKVNTPDILTYRCFTYGENDLIEKNMYLIKVKEFNWKIKSVNNLEKDFENKFTIVSLFFPFLLILILFGTGLLVASLRMDYCIKNGLPWLDNLPAIIIFSIFVLADLLIYYSYNDSDEK